MSLWIDSDMGVDDLFAVLLVMQHREIDGISLSFGNALLDRVEMNAAGAAAEFGWTVPIHSGADRAILGSAETAERVLGPQGLPTRGAGLPPARACFPPALPAMVRWLERQDKVEILALGPLTNLAVLALARPDLLPRIGRLVWMGGAVGVGNHTASAEFNALADPEALAILMARQVPLTMVDLDVCRQVEVTEADVTSLRASSGPHADLLSDLLGGYLDIALTRGRPAMALYDPVAAAVLLRPDLFTLAEVRIDMELAGQHTRGRTVVSHRAEPNARIVTEVEAPAVRALCLGALTEVP